MNAYESPAADRANRVSEILTLHRVNRDAMTTRELRNLFGDACADCNEYTNPGMRLSHRTCRLYD